MGLLDQFEKDAVREMNESPGPELKSKNDAKPKSQSFAPLLVGFIVLTLAKVIIPDTEVRLLLYGILVVVMLGWFFLVEQKRRTSVSSKQVKAVPASQRLKMSGAGKFFRFKNTNKALEKRSWHRLVKVGIWCGTIVLTFARLSYLGTTNDEEFMFTVFLGPPLIYFVLKILYYRVVLYIIYGKHVPGISSSHAATP